MASPARWKEEEAKAVIEAINTAESTGGAAKA
jgi:hypothetical protein